MAEEVRSAAQTTLEMEQRRSRHLEESLAAAERQADSAHGLLVAAEARATESARVAQDVEAKLSELLGEQSVVSAHGTPSKWRRESPSETPDYMSTPPPNDGPLMVDLEGGQYGATMSPMQIGRAQGAAAQGLHLLGGAGDRVPTMLAPQLRVLPF